MLRRFVLAALLIAAVAGLSGCTAWDNLTEHQKEIAVKDGETEGVTLTVGGLKYQVQISRILNPYDLEDREYLYQLPPIQAKLPATASWFGVFMRVQNSNDEDTRPLRSTANFSIEDTRGARFRPILLPQVKNANFYNPTVMRPGAIFPEPNTTAGSSTTQGGLVLFKIPTIRLENRPLRLRIVAPTGTDEASVKLDV